MNKIKEILQKEDLIIKRIAIRGIKENFRDLYPGLNERISKLNDDTEMDEIRSIISSIRPEEGIEPDELISCDAYILQMVWAINELKIIMGEK